MEHQNNLRDTFVTERIIVGKRQVLRILYYFTSEGTFTFRRCTWGG